MAKTVMAWSKCKVEIGKMPAAESMAASLSEIKPVKYQSSELTAEDGDTLQMQEEGGGLVGYETLPGSFSFACRIIEPDDTLYTTLGIGAAASDNFNVSSHVVADYFSLQVTPLHVGAKGFRAPKCSVSVKPGFSSQDGNYVDLTFGILLSDAGYWYQRFTKAED